MPQKYIIAGKNNKNEIFYFSNLGTPRMEPTPKRSLHFSFQADAQKKIEIIKNHGTGLSFKAIRVLA